MSKQVMSESKLTAEQALLTNMRDRSLQNAALRATIAEEEVSALRQQHIILKNLCEQEREKNAHLQKQVEKLNQQLSEKEKRSYELQNKRSEQRPDNEHAKEILSLKEENALLTKSLHESQQQAKQLERVIQFVRKRGEEAVLETQQLREEFQSNQRKIAELTQQLESFQEAQNQTKQHVQDAESLRLEKEKLESHIDSMRSTLEEKEQSLRMAQQHLAKKMREAAILAARNEEIKQQHHDLQKQYSDAQQAIEQLKQQEQTLSLQLQNSMRDSQQEKLQLQQKVDQLQERCKEQEKQNQQLRFLEEKQKQVENVLQNLSTIFSSPQQPVEKPLEVRETAPQAEEQELFNRPHLAKRKQTLFD